MEYLELQVAVFYTDYLSINLRVIFLAAFAKRGFLVYKPSHEIRGSVSSFVNHLTNLITLKSWFEQHGKEQKL